MPTSSLLVVAVVLISRDNALVQREYGFAKTPHDGTLANLTKVVCTIGNLDVKAHLILALQALSAMPLSRTFLKGKRCTIRANRFFPACRRRLKSHAYFLC